MRRFLALVGLVFSATAVCGCPSITIENSEPVDGSAPEADASTSAPATMCDVGSTLGCHFCLTTTNIKIDWPSDPKSTRSSDGFGELSLTWDSDTHLERFNLQFFMPGGGPDLDFFRGQDTVLTGTFKRNASFDATVPADAKEHGYIQGGSFNAQTAPILSGNLTATFTLDEIKGTLSVKGIDNVTATGTFSGVFKPKDSGSCR